MSIQSLSVIVPNKGCVNNCKFCVSRMHEGDQYENMITKPRNLYFSLYKKDYVERLQYARDNGCNTVILTGDSEPQQNWEFLKLFGMFNELLDNPFKNIEIQMSGTNIDDGYLFFLRHHVGVNTIALSTANLFDDSSNFEIQQTPEKLRFDLAFLCSRIKIYRLNLRLCLNMSDVYNKYFQIKDYRKTQVVTGSEQIFNRAGEFGANQLTFRVLYTSGNNTPQDKWIEDHQFNHMEAVAKYIRRNGKLLRVLEYGQQCYSVDGISTIIDDDCMSQVAKKDLKYLILRPDCKLYSQWDDPGSLIF